MNNFSSPRGRIALLFLYDSLDPFTFVRDALSLLIEHGYLVDIYAGMSSGYRSSVLPEGITIMRHPEAFLFFKDRYPRIIQLLRKGGRQYQWFIMNLYRPLVRKLSFYRILQKRNAILAYTCVIGTDPEGLVSAYPLAKMFEIPLAFWSLELLFSDEISNPAMRKLKHMEVTASRDVHFAIIQDAWRGKALSDENGIASEKLIFVPNAPRGVACRRKSDYLYRRLGIDPKRKIVICAGMLGQWTMSAELVKAAAAWPEGYTLVMQSPVPKEFYQAQSYLDEMIGAADLSRVVFSFDPVPAENYRDMMDSADFGLAFYSPGSGKDTTQGRNVQLMGLSSGKFGGFLHSGLPVVVNDAVIGPKEMVEKWGCGICVSQPEQIERALETIFQNYGKYSSNAVLCFDQDLELEASFSKVIEQIDRVKSR
jgi:hypothetical protein